MTMKMFFIYRAKCYYKLVLRSSPERLLAFVSMQVSWPPSIANQDYPGLLLSPVHVDSQIQYEHLIGLHGAV